MPFPADSSCYTIKHSIVCRCSARPRRLRTAHAKSNANFIPCPNLVLLADHHYHIRHWQLHPDAQPIPDRFLRNNASFPRQRGETQRNELVVQSQHSLKTRRDPDIGDTYPDLFQEHPHFVTGIIPVNVHSIHGH
jgi:hypothetical protein